jgi:hypothetical protein
LVLGIIHRGWFVFSTGAYGDRAAPPVWRERSRLTVGL